MGRTFAERNSRLETKESLDEVTYKFTVVACLQAGMTEHACDPNTAMLWMQRQETA